jgi:hypothetical protein
VKSEPEPPPPPTPTPNSRSNAAAMSKSKAWLRVLVTWYQRAMGTAVTALEVIRSQAK